MKRILKHYEDIALSDNDIFKLLQNKVNIVLYPDLYNYSNIDEVMGDYEACVLLFEARPKYGHWVCIFKLNDKEIEFFNPYGGFPDDSLLQINKNFRKESHQDYPILSQLLLQSPYELTYNEFQFQKKNKNIKTCGRHCVVRLLNRDLTLYKYVNFLNKISKKFHADYDEIVTIATI